MVDAVGTNRYTYTAWGALLSEDGPWADDTVTYAYTTNRLRSKLTLGQPNASDWAQTYAYDKANRLTNTTSPAGAFGYRLRTGKFFDPVDFTFGQSELPTAGSLVERLTLPSTAYITNAYDTLARLTGTWLKNSSHSTLNAHTYELNDGHQRTKQTRTGGDFVDYTYDPIGQLQTALGKGNGGTTNRWNEQFRYTYDAAGNLSNRVQNVLTNVFAVNNLNELTAVVRTNSSLTVGGNCIGVATSVTVADNGNSPVAALRYADATFARTNVTLLNGTNTFVAVAQDANGRADTNTATAYLPTAVTFLYDLNGNMRTNGSLVMAYDDENQLIAITNAGAWASVFSYDGRMRRRIRKEFTWRNSAWVLTNEVRYLYDGNLVLQDRNEFNVATKTFTRGLDLSGSLQAAGGIGGLLCFSDHTSGPTYHIDFHADGNGNVTALVDRNQQVVARYLYDPFGKTLASSGPIADLNLYCFSSTELHVQSGLLYYLYRYYDLNLQRWVNRDPIEENGGINLFACAANSPINWVDLFGAQSSISTPAGAAAAAEAEAISLGFPSAAAMRLATKIADIVAKYAAAAIATAGTTSFCKGPKDPCKGLRNQLNLHIGKLLQYINDPLSMDHLGLLRNAAPDVQDRLIKGRIDSLLKQIKNFRTQLEACEKLNGLQ